MKNLNQLFEQIPTAKKIKEELNDKTIAAIQDFVERVSRTMESTTEESFTIQAKSTDLMIFEGFHGQKVKNILMQKGWNIELISDQRNQRDPREGDYFEISMVNLEPHYSQLDR